MVDVAVLALDGVLDAALGASVDVLRAANRIARAAGRDAPFAPILVGARRKTVVTGSGYAHGLDASLADVKHAAVVVIPGLDAPFPHEIDGALGRNDTRAAIGWISGQHAAGALVLASCTATFLVAEAGLLSGEATTSWYLAPHFRRRYPAVALREEAMVVASRRVVTAGAALSHLDLMLWLVRRIAGPTVADHVARYLVVEDRPTQARYLALDHLGTRSPEVLRAERYMRKHLTEPITLASLAQAARVSPRTLARRFEEAMGCTPMRFLRRLRVERAAHILQTSRDSVETVAAAVGYRDPVALRRLLRRELGKGARDLRRR